MSTSNWKIEDSLFYPLGLFNYSSESKIVFVTWTFDCLFTYIFKKAGDTSSSKDFYKVLINGTIQDIIGTEYNTLVLMADGHVHYFSSCKKLRRLKFLSGVQCMSSREKGFALIRVDEENSVLLEIFEDFSNDNEAESSRHVFDITFDVVNIFNSSWKDEKFSLLPISIKKANKSFIDLVAKKNINSDEIYLFSISNSLFSLFTNHTEAGEENGYEISLIITVSSQIETIRLMQSENALLIFMSCGAIDIIFYSHLTKLLDRTVHKTNSEAIATTFANDCFLYSDGHKISKIEIVYDEKEHTFVVNEQTKVFPNIVALTWVRSIQKLVCLSENNIFYTTKFTINEAQSDDLFELNDIKINEIERTLQHIVDLVDEPNKIHTAIENEVFKQEVIAIAKRKEMYSKLASAEITFHSNIPEFMTTTLLPDSGSFSTKDHYFVNIAFKITWNEIFRTGLWNLVINLSSQFDICKIIKIDKNIIKDEFNVLIPVLKEECIIPPNILVEMACFISVEKDFAYIALPIKLKNFELSNLFTHIPLCMKNRNKYFNKLDKILSNLAEKINPLSDFELSEKKFSAKLQTPLIMSIDDLYEMFSIKQKECKENPEIKMYFLGKEITVKYVEVDNYVQIYAEDPIALFYAKLVITKGLSSDYYDDETINIQAAFSPLMKIQCELEGSYGEKEYAARLNRLYTQLRSEIKKI